MQIETSKKNNKTPFLIVGLGNPGKEYEKTRHNIGRIVLDDFAKSVDFPEFDDSKKYKALISEGKLGNKKVLLLEPETFMNLSGKPVALAVKENNILVENIVVIYDDLDLGLGDFKISFGRGSGGHKGIESIIKSLKTKDFIRIRVGISPLTITGKIRKPKGLDFIMKNVGKSDLEKIKKINKTINLALEKLQMRLLKKHRLRQTKHYF